MPRGIAIPAFVRAWIGRSYRTNPHITLEDIARSAGCTATAVTKMAQREGWARAAGAVRGPKGPPDAPIPVQLAAQSGNIDSPAGERRMLLDALWLVASRHVAELQSGTAGEGMDTARERARDTQALMTIARTVEKLMDMERDLAASMPPPAIDEGPADIDEFRREVARRLQTMLGRPPGG